MKTSLTTTTGATKRRRRTYRRRAPRRRPVAGLLEPRQVLRIAIDPPLRPHEQPVAVTPNAGDIILLDATQEQVSIRNETDRVVAYLVAIVPRAFVKAATVPWKRIASDLGTAVRESGVLARFARLLK